MCKGPGPHRHKTMNFSQERFVNIGQTLYTGWLNQSSGLGTLDPQDRRVMLKTLAEMAFEAAEEFAKVFDGQEG